MGRNKMIAKSCPKCSLQVAVASKSCKCGHTFFAARRTAESCAAEPPPELRRRTGRVQRAQPQYYDAQDYQKQGKRGNRKRSLSEDTYKGKDIKGGSARGRRKRALKRAEAAGSARGSERSTPVLQTPQLVRCGIVLDEINRKMSAVQWQPPVDAELAQ